MGVNLNLIILGHQGEEYFWKTSPLPQIKPAKIKLEYIIVWLYLAVFGRQLRRTPKMSLKGRNLYCIRTFINIEFSIVDYIIIGWRCVSLTSACWCDLVTILVPPLVCILSRDRLQQNVLYKMLK